MTKRNPRVQVLLSCGHYAYWHYDSARMDARTCYKCREISTAVQIHSREWAVHCTLCRYVKTTAQDAGEADRLAARHGHPCVVVYQKVEAMLREPLPGVRESDSLTLFDFDTAEPPPF